MVRVSGNAANTAPIATGSAAAATGWVGRFNSGLILVPQFGIFTSTRSSSSSRNTLRMVIRELPYRFANSSSVGR